MAGWITPRARRQLHDRDPAPARARAAAELRPAVNEFIFSSDRTLADCSLAIANGESVHRSGTSCTTQNRVSTIAASAISSFKGVKGDVDEFGNTTRGAVNVNNAAIPCASDAQGFYRSPCAADTVIGGEDLWKLRFTNGGNVPATSATDRRRAAEAR